MMKSLVQIQSEPHYMETLRQQCEILSQAGDMIPSHWNGPTATVAMMLADELGIGRVTALRGMYPVKGKVSMESRLMLALCLPRLSYWHVKGDDNSATATARRKGMDKDCEPTSVTFTFEDAKRAGYATKENYKKQPDVMLRWRAVAGVLRIVCADALEGVYTHDELNVPTRVTEDGNLVLDDSMIVEESQGVAPAPTPEPQKEKEKPAETVRVNTREIVKAASPWGSPQAEQTARDAGNKRAAKNINDERRAAELWLPPMEWQEWMSAALLTLKDAAFRDKTIQALHQPKNRTLAAWSGQMFGAEKELTEAGIKHPPMPSGVFTEAMQQVFPEAMQHASD
ncbi:MAG TPA: hypothetical protein VMX94_02690 [Armatimonadota bacterium]|nr:hypothetical protein [Armatimonadota bacterium]